MDISYQVREANRLIYNKLANQYEIIDGRRSQDLFFWVKKKLQDVANIVGKGDILLDIGCGTGFAAEASKGLFSRLYGVDISKNILHSSFSHGIFPICADAQMLPFKNRSVDVVILFSVIHHFYDYKTILSETYRILKPQGVIYIDHDMNKYFFKNFHFFINIYRKMTRKERILNKMNIGKKLYSLSEYHSKGIDSEELKEYLISLGFKIIKNYYHWYGLSPLTNFIFGERRLPREIAPLAGFIAQK